MKKKCVVRLSESQLKNIIVNYPQTKDLWVSLHKIFMKCINEAKSFVDMPSDQAQAMNNYDPSFAVVQNGHFGNNGYQIDKVEPWDDFEPGKEDM